MSAPVVLSPLDEARFGIRTARVTDYVTAASLSAVFAFCVEHGVKCLIAKSRAEDTRLAQDMERLGCTLMETSMFLTRDLTKRVVPPHDNPLTIRPFRAPDEPSVRLIAALSFQGYYGHYHADRRLDPAACTQVYVDWASRSCVEPGVADAVFIAEWNEEVIGFLTLKRNSADEGQPVLSGVPPEHRGRGAYRALIRRGLEWSQGLGAKRSVGIVHVANAGVLRTLGKLGYEPEHAFYSFHRWFD